MKNRTTDSTKIQLVALMASVCLLALTTSRLSADCRINDLYQTAAPERFEQVSEEIIEDKVTGLMWRKCLVGLSGPDCGDGEAKRLSWPAALAFANKDTTAGYTDWRLPNIKELASLTEYSCVNPALDVYLFPNAASSPKGNMPASYVVWSATPYYDSGLIRYLDFSNGSDNSLGRESLELVRLVRDVNITSSGAQ
ncbi:MAG: DUF1566 domain-containing protein [Gammaproteobacteria bacterium]|nr:DUF1566 domain-containing protein [Gammaproteobacteria bacterium]